MLIKLFQFVFIRLVQKCQTSLQYLKAGKIKALYTLRLIWSPIRCLNLFTIDNCLLSLLTLLQIDKCVYQNRVWSLYQFLRDQYHRTCLFAVHRKSCSVLSHTNTWNYLGLAIRPFILNLEPVLDTLRSKDAQCKDAQCTPEEWSWAQIYY